MVEPGTEHGRRVFYPRTSTRTYYDLPCFHADYAHALSVALDDGESRTLARSKTREHIARGRAATDRLGKIEF